MRFVAAVMAGVVLSAASAASVFTPGGAFTATGSLTILKGPFALQCNASAQIVGVPGAGGTVVSVTFSGTPACSATGPTGLPWPITPTSTTAATLSCRRHSRHHRRIHSDRHLHDRICRI